MNNFIENLKTKGFSVEKFDECLNIINLDDIVFVWEPNYNLKENVPKTKLKEIERLLCVLHLEIQKKYLNGKVKSSELVSRRLWEGFTEETDVWHNDLVDGPNVFFLLYFDDMTKTNDGALWVKNSFDTLRIVPTPGTLVALNQENPSFLHKAEKSKTRRITASFEFNVEW
jgi:hypothetical protein